MLRLFFRHSVIKLPEYSSNARNEGIISYGEVRNMFDFILDLVMKYTPLEAWDVSTDSTLRDDLKMDRSDLFLLRNDLGNMLETEIDEADMDEVITVMDLLKLAEKYAKM